MSQPQSSVKLKGLVVPDKRGKLRFWGVRECAIIGTPRQSRTFLLASTIKSLVPDLL